MKDFIIAVDFDGTCVEHNFPLIGENVPFAVETLQWLQNKGVKLLLWTMRSGDHLAYAVDWWVKHGLQLHGINTNPAQKAWTSSPKAYAHLYIDDAALGCPLIHEEGKRPYVNWVAVRRHLEDYHFYIEPIVHGSSVTNSQTN